MRPPGDPVTGYLKLRSLLFDRVTGLPAYAAVVEDVRDMLEGRRQAGLLHFELVNLELVESLYGWQVFDRVVARAAATLRACVGRELPAGTVLALDAPAGDRLLAFVPHGPEGDDVDHAGLSRAAAAVAARLEESFDGDDFGGLSPRLAVRDGYALLSEDPFYRFERRVHAAVHEARTLRDRREQRRVRSLGAELKRIIAEEHVSAVFQPVVSLSSGDVVGHEAFLRGPRDSVFELPHAMFRLSSSVGVAGDLDRLARRTVLREARAVRDCGRLFVNVLPVGLTDPDWRDGPARDLLEAAGLTPADVVLELSERAADEAPGDVVEACRGAREAGFRIALDDVGTGFASLATVESVRPDYLKVDPIVVREVHRHLLRQELLASILRLADRLGCEVVAEGVEAEEEAVTLRSLGTPLGQGYLYAVPAPALHVPPTPPGGSPGG